jgi:chromosome segregation ATPase
MSRDNTILFASFFGSVFVNAVQAGVASSLRDKVDELNSNNGDLAAQNMRLAVSLRDVKTEHDALLAEFSELSTHAELVQNENAKVKAANAKLNAENEKLTTAKKELSAANAELTAAKSALSAANGELTARSAELTAANSGLVGANAELVTEKDVLRAELRDRSQELAAARQGADEERALRAAVEARCADLERQLAEDRARTEQSTA